MARSASTTTAMRTPLYFYSLILLLLLISANAKNHNTIPKKDLVHKSCSHALFPKDCLRTLSAYIGVATTLPTLLRAEFKVTLHRSTAALDLLAQLKGNTKRENNALSSCIEQIRNSMFELHETLNEVRKLSSGDFQWHINNIQTWVSAVLTDDDTCLDGFKELGVTVRFIVKKKINLVVRSASNALTMVDLLEKTHEKKG